jgi:hypothetical protein
MEGPFAVNLHEWGLFNSSFLPRIEIRCQIVLFRRLGSSEEHSGYFVVRDRHGQALAYVYFENDGRRSPAKMKLLTRDEARRIAANIVKLLGC